MGMTLFAVGALVAPLLGGLGRAWLGRNASRAGRHQELSGAAVRVCAAHVAAPSPVSRAPSRPLRVVRVAEPLRGPASAGRMVISGRMADVCAELDRLAALETAMLRR